MIRKTVGSLLMIGVSFFFIWLTERMVRGHQSHDVDGLSCTLIDLAFRAGEIGIIIITLMTLRNILVGKKP